MALDGFYDGKAAVSENRVRLCSPFKKLRYSDGVTSSPTTAVTGRKCICTVPAKSIITNIWVRKVTNFNAAGNDYLTVGSLADDDLLLDDLDISSAAATLPVSAEDAANLVPYYTASDLEVWATYVYSSTAPTTGECDVAVEWMAWTQEEQDY